MTVRFGLVWVCLGDDPLDDILDDAGYLDPVNDMFLAGPFTTRVSAAILTDNFLDAAHFPFLHAKTFGGDDDGKPTLRVERTGWRLHQHDRQIVDGAHLDEAVDSAAVYEVGVPVQRRAAHRPARRLRLHLVVRVPRRRRHVDLVHGPRLPARRGRPADRRRP